MDSSEKINQLQLLQQNLQNLSSQKQQFQSQLLELDSALTELSIAIDKTLSTGKFDGFLFDSLSTLLIYNKSAVVGKFVHSLINKIKAAKVTAIFTALEGDTKSDLLKELGMYVDNILHYE